MALGGASREQNVLLLITKERTGRGLTCCPALPGQRLLLGVSGKCPGHKMSQYRISKGHKEDHFPSQGLREFTCEFICSFCLFFCSLIYSSNVLSVKYWDTMVNMIAKVPAPSMKLMFYQRESEEKR